MSFSLFCLFLILLQNRITEQTTDDGMESTTDNTSSTSGNTETTTFTELTTFTSNTDDSNSSFKITQTTPYTDMTTEGTTKESNSSLKITQTTPYTDMTTEGTTEESTTYPTVNITSSPLIQSRMQDKISNDQRYKSYEKKHSSVSVFGIVMASLVGTAAVFYITVLLIKHYGRKSYIVRQPNMELGQA